MTLTDETVTLTKTEFAAIMVAVVSGLDMSEIIPDEDGNALNLWSTEGFDLLGKIGSSITITKDPLPF